MLMREIVVTIFNFSLQDFQTFQKLSDMKSNITPIILSG